MTKFQQGVRRLRRRAKLIPRASKAKENKEMKSCEKVLFLFVSFQIVQRKKLQIQNLGI